MSKTIEITEDLAHEIIQLLRSKIYDQWFNSDSIFREEKYYETFCKEELNIINALNKELTK